MIGRWTATVTPYAFDVFYALAGLEFAVFGWNLWMTYGGDLRTALLAATNKILIISAFLTLLLNGQLWMGQIIQMFIDVGKAASGMQTLSPSSVLFQGFQIFGTILAGATKVGILTDVVTGIALVVAAFVVMIAFLAIIFQFTVTLIQTYLALGMGYFPWLRCFTLDCHLRGALLCLLFRSRSQAHGALHVDWRRPDCDKATFFL